ncbi:DUF4177 domain-containing protein [Mitsuaria sp. CC2]
MNLKFVVGALGLAVFLSGPAFAQQKSTGQSLSSGSVAIPASDQMWEYVVVSYGKTLFGAPQKTLAYRTLGLPDGQEGSDLQKSLDILGRFGWELVSVVGAIGGDQQLILKRRFDRVRSNGERAVLAVAGVVDEDVDASLLREDRSTADDIESSSVSSMVSVLPPAVRTASSRSNRRAVA